MFERRGWKHAPETSGALVRPEASEARRWLGNARRDPRGVELSSSGTCPLR